MTTIYKISGYVRWDAKGDVITGSKGGGSYTPPVVSSGLDGSGVAGQVAFWLDNNTLVGDASLTYEVDSSGAGTLQVDGLEIQGALIDAQDGSLKHLTITAGDATTTGNPAGNLYLKAGDGIAEDNTVAAGKVYITPGNGSYYYSGGGIVFGGNNFIGNAIVVQAMGTSADISLIFYTKGAGGTQFGTQGSSSCSLFGELSVALLSDYINMGQMGNYHDSVVHITSQQGNVAHQKGQNISIEGGSGYYDGNTDGGDIILIPGGPNSGGNKGDIYFKDYLSSGGLPAAGTGDTSVICYNPTTGKLSYGDGSGLGGGDPLWEEDGSNNLSPITAGVDVYAHDFILIP